MIKVDEKWFEDRGWAIERGQYNFGRYNSHTCSFVQCELIKNSKKAKFEHVIIVYRDENGKVSRHETSYVFSAKGNGSEVDCLSGHKKFTEKQILGALHVVGLE